METLDYIDFDYQKYFKEFVELSIYDNNITIADTLGTALEKVKKEYPFLNYNTKETLITISDYNKLAKMLGLKEQTLKKNEYLLVADYDSFIKIVRLD